MCGSNVLFWCLCGCGMCHAVCHGIWPLCSHLSSPSLYNSHVQESVRPARGHCLHHRFYGYGNLYLLHNSIFILQFQYHQSLFLWLTTLTSHLHLRHSHPWNSNDCFLYLCWGSSIITVLLSYSYIITTIVGMKSAAGRRKAFSTCASHITTVAILYGAVFFMYFRPNLSYSTDTDKVASVFYAVVIPMLNPLIYSLRNKDVKGALKKTVGTKLCTGWKCGQSQRFHL